MGALPYLIACVGEICASRWVAWLICDCCFTLIRGYTRTAYEALVDRARKLIPRLGISSDFISGFCGETEDEHKETLSLLQNVEFDQAYMYVHRIAYYILKCRPWIKSLLVAVRFAYSLREKTHAARSMDDDVPEAVKQRRLREVGGFTFAARMKAGEPPLSFTCCS